MAALDKDYDTIMRSPQQIGFRVNSEIHASIKRKNSCSHARSYEYAMQYYVKSHHCEGKCDEARWVRVLNHSEKDAAVMFQTVMI